MTFKWIVSHYKGEVAYELDMRWEILLKDGFFFSSLGIPLGSIGVRGLNWIEVRALGCS